MLYTAAPVGSDDVPVVAYSRISEDGEEDERGVTHQQRTNDKTAARLRWTIVAHIVDNDISASKANVVREGFEVLVSGLSAGTLPNGTPFSGVLAVHEDRLFRRAGDYERFVEALISKPGRRFADARGEKDLYSETAEGFGLVGVAFAKIEARKVQRRMRQWHRDRADDGASPGGTRPFGWLPDRLTKDPKEAPLLKKAAEEFANSRSLNSIVRDWQSRGVLTTLGNQWTQRSLRATLANPRLCGWRRINGELIRDGSGEPVRGNWEPIVDPETWLAIDAILAARRGRRIDRSGAPADDLPGDHREHKFLLGGILRCGKTLPDGTACNARLRVTHQRDCAHHIYACPAKGAGGCGGLGRRGDKVDEYITELVLAKLEERTAMAEPAAWTGGEELERIGRKLATLRQEWQDDKISDDLFFGTVRQLETRQRELRNERARHAAVAQREATDTADIRRRWNVPPEEGGLDISQKRAYIREALYAIIVLPVGRGKGSRNNFNPDLLVPIWREG